MSPNQKSHNKKILIIEDEEALSHVLETKLRKEKYQVSLAEDGEQGLLKIREEKPDLILLDIVMPKIDGFQVMEEMKEDKELKDIPVMIISNSGQPVEIEKAKALGADEFLIKTEFDPQEVIDKVQHLLGNEEVSADPSSKTQFIANSIQHQKKQKGEENSGRPKKGQKTILIVEDDKFLRDLCKLKLTKEGFHVSSAVDGEEGMGKISAEKPDLVLLDIVLPGVDGFQILERVKDNPDESIKNIPVILLTNLGQESDVEKGLKLGAQDYLIKAHFTTDEIVQKVRDILAKSS